MPGHGPPNAGPGLIGWGLHPLLPIPTCCRSAKPEGKGWSTAAQCLAHVGSTHVANGEIPPAHWLNAHAMRVCQACLRLGRRGARCPGLTEDCRAARPADGPYRLQCSREAPSAPIPPPPAPRPAGHPLTAPHPTLEAFLTEELGKGTKVLRHVPRGALGIWGTCLAQVIQSFSSHPTWESLRDLLLFPKLSLQPANAQAHCSAKANVAAVCKRVAAFQQGGFEALWSLCEPSDLGSLDLPQPLLTAFR